MAQLPSGTVTLLFTDIEGSTALLQRFGARYSLLLDDYRQLFREIVRRRSGIEVDTQGDSFFVAFERSTDALLAAIDSQKAIDSHAWPDGATLRVRMGLHTGEPATLADGYVGIDVNRAARIAAAAHGGQILLSLATASLVEGSLPEGAALRDLGEHRLKDLHRDLRIFQLLISGLPSDFPPIRSLEAHRHNLPVQTSTFVGRDRERREIGRLAAHERLVSLVGPGGTGKTRLAQIVAADLLETERFADGVWLVELAALSEPELVVPTIGRALGLRDESGTPALREVVEHLRSRSVLLVLDNCEHLIEECARVVEELMRSAPRLGVLATSREPLGVPGETVFRVPSLAVPQPGAHTASEVAQFDAVRLFVDRAHGAQSSFMLEEGNAAAIAEVCRRLDGIPLAIELAASRSRVLSVEQIARRLDDRFRLLSGGSRTALPRQQTLRALIDWSYDLLADAERVLMRRLSVFCCSFEMEAAEAVCTGASIDASDVMSLVANLVDKSLLVVEEDVAGTHYALPETVRQYAGEKLVDAAEAAALRDRHLAYYTSLAEQADPRLRGPDQRRWLARLTRENDNFRAALEWAGGSDGGERQLRLAIALWRFWRMRSFFAEGRHWLEGALARGEALPASLRARGLMRAGSLANYQGDYRRAQSLIDESLRLFRELGDPQNVAHALNLLGENRMNVGDFELARGLLEESRSISGALGDSRGSAYAGYFLGSLLMRLDRLDEADSLLQDALERLAELGDRWWVASTQLQLGWIKSRRGSHAEAIALMEVPLAYARESGDQRGIARSLAYLADSHLGCGEIERARGELAEALRLFKESDNRLWETFCFEALAQVAVHRQRHARAARLLGVADRMRELMQTPPFESDRERRAWCEQRLGTALSPARFEAERRAGRALTREEAVALALQSDD